MQIIVADIQAIFRAGIARVCHGESTMRIAAQCVDLEELQASIAQLPESIVLFSSSITSNHHGLIDLIEQVDSRSVMILEHDVVRDSSVVDRLNGILLRSVAGPQLIDCLHRVAAGDIYRQRAVVRSMPASDHVGTRAVQRLTQRELQIVALVSRGCKTKQIADHLGTKEQVVKNYLRNIYGKTGVSDRLELTIFTLQHRVLTEAVEAARLGLMRTA
jgi:DNA-binding NarL/FixJ family response regulator